MTARLTCLFRFPVRDFSVLGLHVSPLKLVTNNTNPPFPRSVLLFPISLPLEC